ncbi:NTE family protein [Constrictibacter sp. MBR-5]|jgi:NTE family protein|uniref:patatin-like phospholipase family protein n=1 Tax=Constrictibacter sp. MBR-5 TaxID=3156467 RepID=UPI0033952C06
MSDTRVALVLAGGIGLGAYEAGAYTGMDRTFGTPLDRIAGSSIGAVNAALIAGNEPSQRVRRLRAFWTEMPSLLPALHGIGSYGGSWRSMANWLSALQVRTVGRRGIFHPKPLPELFSGALGIYDLSPLRATLERMADFDRLNGGDVSVAVVATDIATGEAVTFDTAAGDRIGPDHLLASCGFLPEFEPTEIEGRLLGDGALTANAPVDAVLTDRPDEDLICFVVDLFARDGGRPDSLLRAQERRLDLLLANQTETALAGLQREDRLRRLLGEAADAVPPDRLSEPGLQMAAAAARRSGTAVLHLSYRSADHDAASEKQYDFSPATMADRWKAGALDMAAALDRLRLDEGRTGRRGFVLHRIRRETKREAPA